MRPYYIDACIGIMLDLDSIVGIGAVHPYGDDKQFIVMFNGNDYSINNYNRPDLDISDIHSKLIAAWEQENVDIDKVINLVLNPNKEKKDAEPVQATNQ